MNSATLLDLLTKGATYELHTSQCESLDATVITDEDDADDYERASCDCPGPDLLKEIIHAISK